VQPIDDEYGNLSIPQSWVGITDSLSQPAPRPNRTPEIVEQQTQPPTVEAPPPFEIAPPQPLNVGPYVSEEPSDDVRTLLGETHSTQLGSAAKRVKAALRARDYFATIDAVQPTFDAAAAALQRDPKTGNWNWPIPESQQARQERLERERRAAPKVPIRPVPEAQVAAKKAHEILDRHSAILAASKEKIEKLTADHALAVQQEREAFRAGAKPTVNPDDVECQLKVERRRFAILEADIEPITESARAADAEVLEAERRERVAKIADQYECQKAELDQKLWPLVEKLEALGPEFVDLVTTFQSSMPGVVGYDRKQTRLRIEEALKLLLPTRAERNPR